MTQSRPSFRRLRSAAAAAAVLLLTSGAQRAEARDELCDPSYTNCRIPLIALIQAETKEIDVGMWFMEDARYSNAIIARMQAGVKVRIIFDNRSDDVGHPANSTIVDQLAAAGAPLRRRVAKGIEHWKVMLFDAQNTVYFGSANFSADAFVPVEPYVNYVDETVYFTDNPSVVDSFRTKFDDAWVDATNYADYANVPLPLSRAYPVSPIDPELNFPPGSGQDFVARSMQNIDAEPTKIDAMMYRIVDDRALSSLTKAKQRGVPIRLIVDPQQYRDPTRQGVAYYVDKLFMAGIPMKFTVHQGLNHGKLALLYGQGLSIFGSSNWTVPSANSQHEENYFTRNPALFDWFVSFFERRWNNTSPAGVAETGPFAPLPPDKPANQSPAAGAGGLALTGVTLKWIPGPWGQYYDIYFGTSANPPLFAANRFLGPSITGGTQVISYVLPTLQPGTTYYWKVVSKTAANLAKSGDVWSFTTAGTPQPLPSGANTVVLWASNVPSGSIVGDWTRIADGNAAGGFALQNPDRGRTKIAPALSSPATYFEASFNAVSGAGYRVWIRMRAQNNSLSNDSVHIQFSDSVDANGSAWARIGTTSSLEPVLQEGPSGATPHGYGWTDNGWQTPGAPVYFAGSGTHTIRIQQREDGAIVDQIVLSPDAYFLSPPGTRLDDTTILPASDGSGPPPPPPPPSSAGTIVLWTNYADSSSLHGSWQRTVDSTAASGGALRNPNANHAKIAPALASPISYFEMTFTAAAGTPYHLWLRMKADGNSTSNDSVHVQFSDSLTGSGTPTARIGTTSSAEVVLQAGSAGPSPHGWGWADNGWDTAGAAIYFASTGTHTIRIQQREDGVTVDQIVLSPDAYSTAPPGPRLDDTTILPYTQGGPPPPPPATNTVVLWPSTIPNAQFQNRWQKVADASAAGNAAAWNPNLGQAKIVPALASPSSFLEMTFTASAAKAYHVWVRMRAEGNSTSNDSIHLQFSDSIDAGGNPVARIGTTGSAEFVLQAGPSGSAPQGWGWTDNGWGALGANLYFAATGTHTLRIQQREDGPTIDQIVISPDAYLSSVPGLRLNDTTILPNTDGASPIPPAAPTSSAATVVLRPGAIAGSQLIGRWEMLADATAAGVEMTFDADAGKPYHVWVRIRAENNATANDSLHLQFDHAARPARQRLDHSRCPGCRIGP